MPAKLSGQIFGHYKLDEMLGTGGMSLVYRARQMNIERDVAIKIMAPALSSQEGFVKRFKQEAEIFAKLEHPHIVPIYDYDQHEKYLYLVLRLIPGGSLSDRLSQVDGVMPLETIAKIVDQVANALDYAHQKHIIHRDLKPGNILLDNNDNAYLMDFGIAKIISETKGGAISALLGTPAYIAPEQWQSFTVDHRADVYSLGVVVYKMLTGELPFAGGSPFYLMYSHLHGETPRPSQHRVSLSEEVDRVLVKALAKRPDDRYNSAGEFAQAFRRAVEQMEAMKKADHASEFLNPAGQKSFRPDTKRDSRLDKLWIAVERTSGHVFVTPDIEELFQPIEDRRTAKMDDIWDELERPPTATYNTRRLQDLLDQIKKDHSFLGVKTQRVNLPPSIAESFERDSGLLLIAVEPDSPAEQSGLYMGDLLVELDGQPMRHQDDLVNALNDERIDRTVNVKFVRTGQMHEVDIHLIKRESGKSTI